MSYFKKSKLKMKEIDVILPCYNPEIGWEKIVVSKYVELQLFWRELVFHLYIVNDGSTSGFEDKVVDYLKRNIPDVHIISYPLNRGKGFALREAVKCSCSDLKLYTDCDFPYTIQSISKVIEMLLEGVDVVVATRDKEYYKCLSWFCCIVSYMIRLSNKYLLGMKYYDTQTGLKGFNQLGKNLFVSTRINTYLFDWEFIYKASKIPILTMKDVSVQLRKNVYFSQFSVTSCVAELKSYFQSM